MELIRTAENQGVVFEILKCTQKLKEKSFLSRALLSNLASTASRGGEYYVRQSYSLLS
jgi:hypothetical protein